MNEIQDIDFDRDDFADVIAGDDRYSPRAYALLCDTLGLLFERKRETKEHVGTMEILEEFRENTLDQYGALAYRVLSEWGVKSCEDIGQMMQNLCRSRRIAQEASDHFEDFAGGYDFHEAFVAPYEV